MLQNYNTNAAPPAFLFTESIDVLTAVLYSLYSISTDRNCTAVVVSKSPLSCWGKSIYHLCNMSNAYIRSRAKHGRSAAAAASCRHESTEDKAQVYVYIYIVMYMHIYMVRA